MNIFDLDNLPGKRFSVRTIISASLSPGLGETIEHAKRAQMMKLAAALVNEPKFFTFSPDQYTNTIDCRSDVVVMSLDDVAELKRATFAAGAKHALGFMPPDA